MSSNLLERAPKYCNYAEVLAGDFLSSVSRMSWALLRVKAPPSSRLSVVTTPSSTSIENLRDLTPRFSGLSLRSTSVPSARVNFPRPSDSIIILSSTSRLSPQARITKASFTEMHANVSTPALQSSLALATNPGRCREEHVGVKAPGSAKSTTFLPLAQRSETFTVWQCPALSKYENTPSGSCSPTHMVPAARAANPEYCSLAL